MSRGKDRYFTHTCSANHAFGSAKPKNAEVDNCRKAVCSVSSESTITIVSCSVLPPTECTQSKTDNFANRKSAKTKARAGITNRYKTRATKMERLSSKAGSFRVDNFKRRHGIVEQRACRSQQRTEERKSRREDVISARRNLHNLSPIPAERMLPKTAADRRREALMKWKTEKEQKKRLEKEKKKPVFVVPGCVHHTISMFTDPEVTGPVTRSKGLLAKNDVSQSARSASQVTFGGRNIRSKTAATQDSTSDTKQISKQTKKKSTVTENSTSHQPPRSNQGRRTDATKHGTFHGNKASMCTRNKKIDQTHSSNSASVHQMSTRSRNKSATDGCSEKGNQSYRSTRSRNKSQKGSISEDKSHFSSETMKYGAVQRISEKDTQHTKMMEPDSKCKSPREAETVALESNSEAGTLSSTVGMEENLRKVCLTRGDTTFASPNFKFKPPESLSQLSLNPLSPASSLSFFCPNVESFESPASSDGIFKFPSLSQRKKTPSQKKFQNSLILRNMSPEEKDEVIMKSPMVETTRRKTPVQSSCKGPSVDPFLEFGDTVLELAPSLNMEATFEEEIDNQREGFKRSKDVLHSILEIDEPTESNQTEELHRQEHSCSKEFKSTEQSSIDLDDSTENTLPRTKCADDKPGTEQDMEILTDKPAPASVYETNSNPPEHDVPYFRCLLASEIEKLNSLCKKWEAVMSSTEAIPEEARGNIYSTVGLAQLLVNDRFKQFGQLLDDSEFGTGVKPVLCSDLQGFWDMVYFQVEDVYQRFDNLTKLQSNNWDVHKPSSPKKRAVKKRTISKVGKSVTAKSKFAEFRAKMKQQKLVSGDQTCNSTDIFKKGDVEVKTFNAGFFQVNSPVSAPKAHLDVDGAIESSHKHGRKSGPLHKLAVLNCSTGSSPCFVKARSAQLTDDQDKDSSLAEVPMSVQESESKMTITDTVESRSSNIQGDPHGKTEADILQSPTTKRKSVDVSNADTTPAVQTIFLSEKEISPKSPVQSHKSSDNGDKIPTDFNNVPSLFTPEVSLTPEHARTSTRRSRRLKSLSGSCSVSKPRRSARLSGASHQSICSLNPDASLKENANARYTSRRRSNSEPARQVPITPLAGLPMPSLSEIQNTKPSVEDLLFSPITKISEPCKTTSEMNLKMLPSVNLMSFSPCSQET